MKRRKSDEKSTNLCLVFDVSRIIWSFCYWSPEVKSPSNEVTLYYSHSADWTDPLIKEFQDRTGIKVNLVGAPTGELVARIRAEKDNPLGDLLWGGGSDSYQVIMICSNRMNTLI